MSPSTVPMTILPRICRSEPRLFSSGSSVATAAFMASPAMTSSGRKASPRPKASPTVFTPATKPLEMASSGSMLAEIDSFASATAASESPSMMLCAIRCKISSVMVSPLSKCDLAFRCGRKWAAWASRSLQGLTRYSQVRFQFPATADNVFDGSARAQSRRSPAQAPPRSDGAPGARRACFPPAAPGVGRDARRASNPGMPEAPPRRCVRAGCCHWRRRWPDAAPG